MFSLASRAVDLIAASIHEGEVGTMMSAINAFARRAKKLAGCFAVVLLCLGAWTATANAAITIRPAGSTVAGKTIGEWSAEYWKWVGAQSFPNDALTDSTGAGATQSQDQPVFFVAQSNDSNPRQRHFVIPSGKFVLISPFAVPISALLTGTNDIPTLRQDAQNAVNFGVTGLHVTLDGTPVSLADILSHRETSPVFTLNLINDPIPAQLPPGQQGSTVSDGYFLMLEPLSPGSHTIEFGGLGSIPGQGSLTVEVTDSVKVPPAVPAMPPTRVIALAGLLLAAGAFVVLRRTRAIAV
jgi:hypothetical protein